jgi:hypothetical protein
MLAQEKGLTCRARVAGWILAVSLLAPQAGQAATTSASPSGGAAANVDLRPAFERWVLRPRIQGKRNTCSVFVVSGGLEYALARREGHVDRLSVEFLNWASNQAAGDKEDGSFFSDLWRGFTVHGACVEQDMPYQDRFDPNLTPSEGAREHGLRMRETGLRLHWIKPWNRDTGLTEDQLAAIKEVLQRQWPVCGGFRWPRQVRWTNDTLGMAAPADVYDGHSVLIVGYRDDPGLAGGGGLLFRNSNHNGRDGWMTYEYARAYMNDAAWIDHGQDGPASVARPAGEVLGPFAALPQGRNRRVSSNQQPGWHTENLDMTWLKPGESVTMPVLEGPGRPGRWWSRSCGC